MISTDDHKSADINGLVNFTLIRTEMFQIHQYLHVVNIYITKDNNQVNFGMYLQC